ncbi:helix-turn-helix domain-containing protein [Streptomyces fradiae]|uniref:helix-turn-helix domain-containing protein n=1 Tax=Streptomyces fradiae TaxID=1906 RepID=UPI003511F614
MTEVARARVNTSEIERGVVPEVAELGNVLRELFNKLGISQSQYAHRVHLDKSVVSRFLSGRRLASQEFIDRLFSEVEAHLGAPVKLEAKEVVKAQRLKALSVTDPDEFRLEKLRGELARSRRDAERADRNVEALHALLEKKEAEARAATDELDRLRLDWGAEIAALRQDLADAEDLRRDAERRGEELREEVLRLEGELSRRNPEGGAAGRLPLAVFQEQLEALWEAEEFAEAGRELTEAAWARPLEEVGALLEWLRSSGRADVTQHFVSDVGRLRPLDDLLCFAPQLAGERVRPAVAEAWAFALASRMTERNAAVLYDGLKRCEAGSSTYADWVLATAVRRLRETDRVTGLVVSALAHEPSPDRLPRTLRALGGPSRSARVFSFPAMAGLAEAGRTDVAVLVMADYLVRRHSRYTLERTVQALMELPEARVGTLLDVMAGLEPGRGTGTAAQVLAAADDTALLDRFLAAVEAHGGLDPLEEQVPRDLARRIRKWRRSRGD